MDPCTLSLVPDQPPPTGVALRSDTDMSLLRGRFRLCLGADGLIPHAPRLPIVPTLLELCRALSMLMAQRCTRIAVPLGAADRLIFHAGPSLHLSVLHGAQPILRDQPIPAEPLIASVLATTDAVLQALEAKAPRLAQAALTHTLRSARDGLAGLPIPPGSSPPPPSADPPPARGLRFVQRADDQLEVHLGTLFVCLSGAAPPITAAALVALVRCAITTRDWPIGQQTVAIDPGGQHRFLLARTPMGLALTIIDAGQHPLGAALPVSLSALTHAAWRCAHQLAPPYAEYAQILAQLLRWARAIEQPPAPRPPPPPDWQAPITAPPERDDPLPVAGLHHLAYRRAWRVEAPGLLRVSASDGRLLIFDHAGVRGLDPHDATAHWRLPALRPVPDGPANLGIDHAGHLVAFEARSGQVRWRQEIDAELPVVGVVPRAQGWIAHTDTTLFGVAPDGQRRWRYDSWYGRVGRPAVHGPLAWTMAEDGFVHGIRLADGARQFATPVSGEPDGSLTLCDAGLLVPTTVEPSGRGALALYGHADGALRWRVRCEGAFAEPPQAHRDSVYALLRDGDRHVLEARRLSDGVLRWRHAGLAPGPLARLHPVDDLLCLKSAAGEVLALSIRDGGPCWRLAPDDPDQSLSRNPAPVARRGILLVPGAAIRVVDPRSGRLIQVLDCGELTPDWLHVWPDGDLAIAEDEAVVRYTLGGHLALVR